MQGLPVADDVPELRPFLYRPTTSALSYLQQLLQNEQRWPPKSLYGLAALAQHHGQRWSHLFEQLKAYL